jgi:TRAP-type C4-dicarboxylate transport system substrate-binding protein
LPQEEKGENTMKRSILLITVMSLALILSGAFTVQAVELKFGHVGAPGSLFSISVDEFVKRVNAQMGGEVTVVG